MDMISLKATVRDVSASPKKMRRDGQVPCVIYGGESKNMTLTCAERELHRVFARAGESTLVELDIDGKRIPVLFKDVTFEPISGREGHVDFYAVDMKKEIETLVPVSFTGESPAVKDQQGIFVVVHESVTVRCLPGNLPHSLTVDISGMAEFHTSVAVKDLQVPTNVKIMEEPSTVIATVQEPRKEEEIAPPTPAEGAVPAEGAAAAPGAEGAAPAAGAEGAPKAEAPAAEGKGKK